MKFFKASANLKELKLLEYIETKEDITQKKIAKYIDASPSMVNTYFDQLEEAGYVVRDYKSAKIVHYKITLEGIKRKKYLLLSYMRELLDLYRLAKNNVEMFLDDIEERGCNEILLYGAGDVADIILSALRDRSKKTLRVLAVIDDNKKLQNKEILGYKIVSQRKISEYQYDAIVITSYTYEDEIKKRLNRLNINNKKIITFFDTNK